MGVTHADGDLTRGQRPHYDKRAVSSAVAFPPGARRLPPAFVADGNLVTNWPWNTPAQWQRLRTGDGCPLCDAALSDVAFRLPSSLVRVPRLACVAGYAGVIAARHVVELHGLSSDDAAAFVRDLCQVSSAVERVSGAAKINLLSLGNLVPHLHVHVCPRRPGDRFEGRALDPGDTAEVYAAGEHARFVSELTRVLAG